MHEAVTHRRIRRGGDVARRPGVVTGPISGCSAARRGAATRTRSRLARCDTRQQSSRDVRAAEQRVCQRKRRTSGATYTERGHASGPAVESADETNAFEKAARLYVRLSKLEITREQREFERVATRYAKFKNFTDKLQALREREQEQVFNQNVSTYLRKQAFTKQLVEHRSRETGVVESPR